MKLFLASRGSHPLSLEKLQKFLPADKPLEKSKILYIPTATNGENGYGSWKESETLKVLKAMKCNLKIVELEDCIFRDIKEDFADIDMIWMGGGFCGYLLYWIRRCELDKLLPELFTKGIIYVGASAGSMVCSKTQFCAEVGDDKEIGASLLPGLGYIDFEIFPHFTDEKRPQIEKDWKYGKLYLLKDGEAITFVDGKVEVLGEERIIVA